MANGTVRRVNYGVVEVKVSGRRAPAFTAIIGKGEVCVGWRYWRG